MKIKSREYRIQVLDTGAILKIFNCYNLRVFSVFVEQHSQAFLDLDDLPNLIRKTEDTINIQKRLKRNAGNNKD